MKFDREQLAQWERERREFRELCERWIARLKAADEHDAARRARLRRWTFGLLGREPAQPTA
jgi:hypothetical protein